MTTTEMMNRLNAMREATRESNARLEEAIEKVKKMREKIQALTAETEERIAKTKAMIQQYEDKKNNKE